MKRKSEQFIIGILLPVTVIVVVVFSTITMVAFHLASTAAGFIFATIAVVAWIGIVIEFMLVYEALVDRWFSKDRSVISAIWFIISAFIAIKFTPNKGIDWTTFIIATLLFFAIFLVPYIIGVRYGMTIMKPMNKLIDKISRKEKMEKERQIEAVISSTTVSSRISHEDEATLYDNMIGELVPALVKGLPEKLQSNDALFLLVLFREDGYLNQDFKPTITKEPRVINQTLYAFIADAFSQALNIKLGKWSTFEELWSLNNGAQLLSNFKTASKDNPTEHQRRIAKLLRKATRLRPKLETMGVTDFLRQY